MFEGELQPSHAMTHMLIVELRHGAYRLSVFHGVSVFNRVSGF